jgi:hypothetical protein
MSSNVNAPRNNNASIFTALVCACLGVLVAGTPVHANMRRAASEVYRFESASVIRNAFAPSRPALKTVASPEENFYQNDKPLAALHNRVVVTRLARAGLPESLA